MKKLILAILVIAVAMPAFASDTRVRALGSMTAPFIEDDSNVFMWPATLVNYANLVTVTAGYYDVVRWGDDTGYYDSEMTAKFGLTYGLGEDNRFGVFGIWWQEHTYGPNNWGLWAGPGPDFSEDIFNKWNVMWALAFETIDIGISFNRADEMVKFESSDPATYPDEDMISYTTLGLGFAMELGDATNLDLAFDYTTVGYTYQNGDTEIWEVDSKSAMALRGRMFYEWTDIITWVPYINYRTGNLSVKSNETTMPVDQCWGLKGFEFDLGLAANLNVNDDNLIIVGIEPYGLYKGEPSECGSDAGSGEISMTILPGFVFGLESDVKEWLTFRAGCSKALVKVTVKDEAGGITDELNLTGAPFEWQLGLGFHVGDFDIDMLLNKEVPFSMGYWITGFSPEEGDDAGTPIGMISMTYSF